MDRKIALIGIVGFVLVIAVMLSTVLLMLSDGEEAANGVSNINIEDYSYKASVKKPAAVIAEFAADEGSDEKLSSELTIYNENLALVKEVRSLFLQKGLNEIRYKDIAQRIDATSVMFVDLDFPETFVVEQNYEYDLVSKSKLLEKYLDREITVEVNSETGTKIYTGVLLGYSDGVLLQTETEVISISDVDKISFPKLSDGLLTKPTLVWKLYTENTGTRDTQTIYLTDGINWRADYIAKVNVNDTKMDFKGWVTTTNNSGTSYPNTKLKLVAGDIHRVRKAVQREMNYAYGVAADGGYAPEQFVEEGLFEYHMYTLGRETNIMNNETKQISLLSSDEVPIKKEFYYDGASQGEKVQVKLNFKNAKDQGLGVPLPKGIVRVYKEDSDGQLQFLGEDEIDHTKTEDEVRLYIGDAFDVTGERTRTESTNIAKGWYRNSYEIKLENQKDEAVEVVVHEYVGRSASITKFSDPYESKSATEIEFTVTVPAKGEKTVTYTVENRNYW
ncbi:MAG: DUF4139 domain-containing protein [Candidatus Diapherotrites archaeon]